MNKNHDDFSCVYEKKIVEDPGVALMRFFSKRLCLGRRVSIGGRGRMRQLSFRYQAADSGSIVLCPLA
jgi:hypothetical protein